MDPFSKYKVLKDFQTMKIVSLNDEAYAGEIDRALYDAKDASSCFFRECTEDTRPFLKQLITDTVYALVGESNVYGIIRVRGNYASTFCIMPAFRNRGYGSILLEYVKEKHGVGTPLFLSVFSPDSDAGQRLLKFYAGRGFERRKTYADPRYSLLSYNA